MYRRWFSLAALGAACLLVAAGCGPSYSTVEVKVTLDGNPVDGATVSFIPKDPKTGTPASGVTNSSGVATINASGKGGVAHGEYSVLVSKHEAPEGVDPGGDPTKNMESFLKGKQGGPGAPGSGKPGMPGMPGPGGSGTKMAGKVKNLIPAKYSDSGNPAFSVTVPVSGQHLLELKSK